MFKSHYIESDHRLLRENKVDTYGTSVFAPDYSITVLSAKMCTNSNEHSMNIRFLCSTVIQEKLLDHEMFTLKILKQV
jgi:hypothetical protein